MASCQIRAAENFLRENRIKLAVAPDKMEEIRMLHREHERLANLALLRSQHHSPEKLHRFGDDRRIAMPCNSQRTHKKIKEVKFERRIFLDVNNQKQEPVIEVTKQVDEEEEKLEAPPHLSSLQEVISIKEPPKIR